MPVGKVSGEDLHSGSFIAVFSLCPHMVGRRDKGAIWALLCESPSPGREGSAPMTGSPLEAPLPSTITLEVRLLQMNFGGTNNR